MYVANAKVSDLDVNNKNFQIARVDYHANKSLSLINHHAHWKANPVGDEISVERMEFVYDKIISLPRPLIFAGDLNVTTESPAMRVFNGALDDLTATHHVSSTLTELNKAKDVACDHILVSPDISVKKFRVSDMLVSDHTALILEFDV